MALNYLPGSMPTQAAVLNAGSLVPGLIIESFLSQFVAPGTIARRPALSSRILRVSVFDGKGLDRERLERPLTGRDPSPIIRSFRYRDESGALHRYLHAARRRE